MQTLKRFVNESASYTQSASTADIAFEMFKARNYNVDKRFIDNIYDIWINSLGGKPTFTPFRFSDSAIKLAHVYFKTPLFKKNIESICTELGYEVGDDKTSYYISINKKKVRIGDGSLGGARAEKGLGYETVIQEQLKDVIVNREYSNYYNYFKPLLSTPSLKAIISEYDSNPDMDLNTKICLKSLSNTHRNSNGELFDKKTFELNTINNSPKKDVLFESGNIIADVKAGDENISVKLKDSQLSGCTCNSIFVDNATLNSVIGKKSKAPTYSEVKDKSDMIAFNNFCSLFKINPEEVYDMYRMGNFGTLSNSEFRSLKKDEEKRIGALIQYLIGGNYWYAKQGQDCIEYVDANPKKFKIQLQEAKLSDSGKSVVIRCLINGCKAVIKLRTAKSNSTLPYRLFVEVNTSELLKTL